MLTEQNEHLHMHKNHGDMLANTTHNVPAVMPHTPNRARGNLTYLQTMCCYVKVHELALANRDSF